MHDLKALTRALREAGDAMPPTHLPDDLFRRGQRRRRRKRVAAVMLAVLLLVPVGLGLGATQHRAALPGAPKPDPAVPSTVHQPRVFQAAVQDSPRGAASMLFSGRGSGLGGVFYSSNVAVVGRDGSYRMLLAELNTHAGGDALLSPDGSHVAMTWPGTHTLTLESLLSRHDIYVADLATGVIRGYRLSEAAHYDSGGVIVGWSPDGRSVAVMASGSMLDLVLLDTVTGASRVLSSQTRWENPQLEVAFSPDGRQLAVQALTALSIVDVADGAIRKLPDLPARRRLAGAGAWRSDGRLAVLDLSGCANDCEAAAANARTWQLRYLDPRTGTETPGPAYDAVEGMVAEVLGWPADGDAVVLSYRASTGPGYTVYEGDRQAPRLLSLHQGGGHAQLIELPPFVDRIDVARDLVTADRFGGPAPKPALWPLAFYVYRVSTVLIVLFVGVPVLVWRVVRRIRRFS